MRQYLAACGCLVIAVALACCSASPQIDQGALDAAALERLNQDLGAATALDALRDSSVQGAIAITDVNVIEPTNGSVAPHQTVLVRGDRIAWVGAASAAPPLGDATIIDGASRYLSPGLTDMHVHSEHLGQHILRLAAGVTSVRDMDGFPWMLRMREAIETERMIGATEYVAGTIISDHPLYGYAVVVTTPGEARQVVRDQAACGYSFIKVHNSLAAPLFDAVADEARLVHLDLVGHVPHDISLRHAIHEGGMRTIEHLKGFLLDSTLFPSDEPYAPALEGAEVWITPTLYTHLDRVHGEEARQLAADPRQRFNPRSRREEWAANIPAEGSRDAMLHERQIQTQAVVMSRLLPLHPRWLVGTDAAGYAFNLAGFGMHDEMLLLRETGLSNAEIVRAATSEPALAMRRPDEFGRVVAGKRADLVLLSANPLDDIAAYRENLGVMARGRWFSREALTAALNALTEIYAAPTPMTAAEGAQHVAETLKARADAGYIFEDSALQAGADAMGRLGATSAATLVRGLMSAPASGVCAVNTPQ